MGFMQNGRTIAAAQTAKATKQLAETQADAQTSTASYEAKVLQQLNQQTLHLRDIRDLLRAQQASS